MSVETIADAKASISGTAAYKTLLSFFDDGEFVPVAELAKSEDVYAEVVAGQGFVNGVKTFAFAQNPDFCSGAMSKAQAKKLKRVYELAMMTGSPVVGFYNSKGGRINEGSALLAGYGEVLNAASKLSGVVPQISVILGDCIGTGALNAVSADFVVAVKDARLSLSTTGENSDIAYNAANGTVAVTAEDEADAIAKTQELLQYLPESNLEETDMFEAVDPDAEGCIVKRTVDSGSVYKLSKAYGENARTVFAAVEGAVVGVINTLGGTLTAADADKIARHVRFCDAFSIPVVSFVDAEGFADIRSASKLASAYAEATTAKISVITGKAYGAAYIALAGEGANADMVYALPDAVVSPVNPEAVVLISEPERLNVPVAEQAAVVDDYAKTMLSAEKAAENGYIDNVVAEDELRNVLVSALGMLSSKRVKTIAKKHSTI